MDWEPRAAIGLDRRAGPIARELQHARRTGEAFLPVPNETAELLAAQVLTLPGGVVAVLERERCEGCGLQVPERVVERRELAEQDQPRAAVGSDVVRDEEQPIVVF